MKETMKFEKIVRNDKDSMIGLSEDGKVYYRKNVSIKTPIGLTWELLDIKSLTLEKVVDVSMSRKSVYLLDSKGKAAVLLNINTKH